MDSSEVCVRVDCECPFSLDWLYYPKDIIGIHRIQRDDSRAVLGSDWAENGAHCHGYWYSQECDEENCNPKGEVVEIVLNCDDCPYRDARVCPFNLRQ